MRINKVTTEAVLIRTKVTTVMLLRSAKGYLTPIIKYPFNKSHFIGKTLSLVTARYDFPMKYLNYVGILNINVV